MARPKKVQPAPPAPLTEEQLAAQAKRRDAYERRLAEMAEVEKILREVAEVMAPAFCGRLMPREQAWHGRVECMFGPETQYRALGMADKGLAEAMIEVSVDRVEASDEQIVGLRTRFQSYATSGNTTADDAEAQGLALVDAARFTRAVVNEVMRRREAGKVKV